MCKGNTPFLLFIFVLLLTGLVYMPGLDGAFIFDDTPNIVNNESLKLEPLSYQSLIRAGFSTDSGPLRRPISMLSFAFNISVCGYSPACFKSVNLAVHILNGILVFLLVRLLLDRINVVARKGFAEHHSDLVALFVSAAWLLHPLQLTSVLYAVQRMNSLSVLFMLAGMIAYVVARERYLRGVSARSWFIGAFALTVPAVLTKENGILLPGFLFLIELIFYRFDCRSEADRKKLKLLFAGLIGLPLACMVVYTALHPDWLVNWYAFRDFTLTERLLTQSRVLWFYAGLIFIPANQKLALFHDDIVISTSLLDPVTTIVSVAGIIFLLLLAIMLRHKAAILCFGILFFLAGHAIESTIVPLELVFEHRNYLPAMGLLLVLMYYLLYPAGFEKTRRTRTIAAILLIALFSVTTALRASQWGDPLLHALLEVKHSPESARINHTVANAYVIAADKLDPAGKARAYAEAEKYYLNAISFDDGNITGLASLYILESRLGDRASADRYEKILNHFEHKKLRAHDANVISKLLACARKGHCKLQREDIDRLVESLESGPGFNGKYAALIYSHLGQHYWNEYEDMQAGLNYTYQATRIHDDMALELNLARLLTIAGDIEKARAVLDYVERNDTFGMYRDYIRDIQGSILSRQSMHGH
ncbi:MAG: hypothetical protein WDZ86_01210 [Gammaproteobacteria bacterium]